jgi:chemotaxis methyl-accepting protein methylase
MDERGPAPAGTVHQERSALRARLDALRGELASAERTLLGLGGGDTLPGVKLLLETGGWRVLAPGTLVVDVLSEFQVEGAEDPAQHVAGEFVHRGRRLPAFDLGAMMGAPAGPERRRVLVVLASRAPFGLLAERAELVGCPALLVPGDPGSPERAWRHTRVFARCGEEVLPILDAEALARRALARAEQRDGRSARTDDLLSRELAAVEALLCARGLSLSPALRGRLRAYARAAAAEGRPAPWLPRVLGGDASAICRLLEAVALGDTRFFRDPAQLEVLRRRLLQVADPESRLRVWSAGCGSGEEAYSVAMMLAAARPDARDLVLGTDVCERSLAHARGARYASAAAEPHPLLDRFLLAEGGERVVAPEVRARVDLQRADVRDPAPARELDAVLCRHVLELLDPAEAARAVRALAAALRPGGYLLLGCTEAALADGVGLERFEEDGIVVFRRPLRATRRAMEPLTPAPKARIAR